MALFQKPPSTPEEIEQSKPLEILPETVLTFNEDEWYARAYRGDASQLTVRAVVMGSVLGFFLSFTNLYIGLKTGWFLGVAITACILSYAIWTFLRGIGLAKTPMTILENNCMQSTASSAGYATGNSLVSAIPALLMLSVTPENPKGTHLPWYLLGAWVFCLACLGVVMAIPMKRNMINREKLTFPSGTAAAVTLQSLYSEGRDAILKARALLVAGIVGMLVPLLKDLRILKETVGEKTVRHALLPGESNLFDILPHWPARHLDRSSGTFSVISYKLSEWNIALDHSVVLIGAGAIVGLRATIWMVAGALYLTFYLGPKGMGWDWVNASGKLVTAVSEPGRAWKEVGIWHGAPLMVAYGLITFALQWKTILRAFTGFAKKGETAAREGETNVARPEDVEVPGAWFVWGMLVAGAAIVLLAWRGFQIPPHLGVLAVFMCFFLALVAARATGETDITPGGPLGKIMQLTYGVLMPQSTTANLMTASITSGASLATADLLNDLKSGYLLGANPRRQFIAQFAGVFTGTIASTLGFFLLVPDASKLVGDKPEFAAPGAQQWKAVAELFKVGVGNLHPMAQQGIIWGVAVGTTLALLEFFVPKTRKYLPSTTGFGLGLLLPFPSGFAMFIGAFLGWIFQRVKKSTADKFLVPIASGLIAGESVIGVIVAALNNFVFK